MKRLVIAGVLVFLGVLIATFPARVAYQWLAPAELRLSGITGSIWNGRASEGYAGGAYVSNIAWTFSPGALLSGRLGFRASCNPASGTMQGGIAVSPGGSLRLSDLSGNVPLNLLNPALLQAGIRGDIAFDFESVEIRNGIPTAARGTITVRDFFVPDLSPSRIGDFRAEFTTGDAGPVGSVEDVSAMLDVAGTITLDQAGRYALTGVVAPTAMTPVEVVDKLRFLGSPNDRGQHEFRFEGQL